MNCSPTYVTIVRENSCFYVDSIGIRLAAVIVVFTRINSHGTVNADTAYVTDRSPINVNQITLLRHWRRHERGVQRSLTRLLVSAAPLWCMHQHSHMTKHSQYYADCAGNITPPCSIYASKACIIVTVAKASIEAFSFSVLNFQLRLTSCLCLQETLM